MRTEVDALGTAGRRDRARSAARALAHLAVPDAVAVSPHAGEVVAAVRGQLTEGCRWRADAFATILHVLAHADVYAQLRTSAGGDGDAAAYDEGTAWEDAVFRALAGFDLVVRNAIVDPDPETRALACLLLGWISTEPATDLELLRILGAAEPEERVRACAGEAVLRLGGTTAEAYALLTDPSAVVRQRVARFLLPSRHSADPVGVDPTVAARARQVLAEPPVDRSWPAEQL